MTRRAYTTALFGFITPFAIIGCDGGKDGTLNVRTEPPTVTIANPLDGTAVDEGVNVQMVGKVKDDKYGDVLDELTVYWSIDGASVCEDAYVEANGDTICDAVFNSSGTSKVTLSVTNPDSETASAESNVTVNPNSAPTIAISSPDTVSTYYADQIISFEASASDGEDPPDSLTVTWESSQDGVLTELPGSPTSDGNVNGATNLTAGEHYLTAVVADSTGRTGSDSVTIVVGGPNSLPACDIVLPTTGTAYSSGDSVDFEATASDADVANSELIVLWESDKDGELGSSNVPNDGNITYSTSTLTSGTHTVTLFVTDEVGGECSDTVRIQVGDEPIVELITPATSDVYNQGDSVVFLANVSDANDDATDLTLEWSSDINGVFSTQGAGSSGEASFAYDSLDPGVHTVSVTVTDPLGFTGYDSATFSINGLPNAPGVSITPDPAQTGDGLQAVVSTDAVDPEGDDVTYSYEWSKNGVSTSITSSLVAATETTRDDTWEVTITSSDPYGEGDNASTSVTIINTPPALASVDLTPDPASLDDVMSCTPGTTSDADGDTVTYSYAWEINGASVLGATTTTLSSGYGSGDIITCIVTPNDGYEDGAAVTSNPVGIDNTAPELSSATLNPGTAYEDTTLSCSAGSASDGDGDTVSFLYAWYVEGLLVSGATDTTLTGDWFNRDEEVYCEITPFDGSNYGAPVDSNTVTIRNTHPELDSAALTPDPSYTSNSMTCSAGTTYDLDGDVINVTYGWQVDGVDVAGVTGAILNSTYTARDNIVTCLVTPSDGTDDGSTVASNTVTVLNTAPSISGVSLSPSSPTSSDTITATPTGWSDSDGDDQGYVWTWYVNSSEIVGVTTSTLESSNFGVGDTIYAIVTPNDGYEDGAPVTSSTITVGNSAPVVASVSVSPTTAYETSTLSCVVESADDTDGDSISYTYAWSVSGGALTVTSSTLDGSYFDKGDAVSCSVIPYDGTDYGDEVESEGVNIRNSAPSVSSVSVSPDPAYTDNTLSCSYSGTSDDDPGDSVTVTYKWEASGVEVGTASSTLASSNFFKSDVVVCTVTPTDSEDAGTPVSSAGLTISNTAPAGSSVSITPATAYTTDDLTADASGWSDIDPSDTESWTYEWFVNSASVGSSELLSSSVIEKTDSVYVVATPYDGSDYGSPVTSGAITIQNSAPTAPGISISPASPEPGETLSCNISSASTDADSDSVSYVYAWTLDGSATSYTSSSISGSLTEHNQTWGCEVYASDGSATSSTVTDSVNVNDGTAPDAPVIGTPAAYTNEEDVTLSGTCEASCDMTFYISDDSGSWTETDTCSSGGSFSHTIYPTRGYITDVYATCEDVGGNVSGLSNTVNWEVCSPADEFDYSDGGYAAGYGDSEGDMIDEWSGRLLDEDVDTLSFVGNILDGVDEDWYVFYVQDGGNAGYTDEDWYYENFNFTVDVVAGASDYNFFIYHFDGASTLDEVTTTDKVTGGTCDYTGEGFDEFDWYSYDSVWSDTRACRTNYVYGVCPDYSGYWAIQVVRESSSTDSCQHYELELSNGLW